MRGAVHNKVLAKRRSLLNLTFALLPAFVAILLCVLQISLLRLIPKTFALTHLPKIKPYRLYYLSRTGLLHFKNNLPKNALEVKHSVGGGRLKWLMVNVLFEKAKNMVKGDES